VTNQRLSALDASFLTVERANAHMHVGWVAMFAAPAEGRLPSFQDLRDHIEARLAHAPRFRQKPVSVPLGLNTPEWVDDPAISVDRHVYWAPGRLEDLVEEVMSTPLRRDRPLWEMWICEHEEERWFAIVGKAHHCMVDGIAAVELVSLLLDQTPESDRSEPEHRRAAAEPRSEQLLARGALDLLGQPLGLLRWSRRLAATPAPAVREATTGIMRASRALDKWLSDAPTSVLNAELSPLRRLAFTKRPLDELRRIKSAYGTTLNDVILAVVAGGLRAYMLRRGEEPVTLKVMVPVSVRRAEDVLGNHISFVFVELPCDNPDPLGRLYEVHASMSRSKREGEPQGSDLVMKAASLAPSMVQGALTRVFAGPRAFNLVVSNIPGPASPMYMVGCKLQAVYPMVPLADNHSLSVGMITIHDQACFGIYADRQALPDVDMLADDIEGAVAELLAGTDRVLETGSLLARARAAVPGEASPFRTSRPGAPIDEAGTTEQVESGEYERELQRMANPVSNRPVA